MCPHKRAQPQRETSPLEVQVTRAIQLAEKTARTLCRCLLGPQSLAVGPEGPTLAAYLANRAAPPFAGLQEAGTLTGRSFWHCRAARPSWWLTCAWASLREAWR